MQLAEGFPLIYEGTPFAKQGYWWETTWKSESDCPTWHARQWQEQIPLPCRSRNENEREGEIMSMLMNATLQ